MKKAWGVAAGLSVLAVAYTGASWYVGQQVEAYLPQQIENIRAEMKKEGVNGDVRLENYQRGVFCSTGQLKMEVAVLPEALASSLGQDSGRLFFNAKVELEHGPLPLGQLTSGSLRPVLLRVHYFLEKDARYQAVYDFFEETYPIASHISVGFDGRSRGTVHVSPGKLAKDEMQMKFSGGDGVAEFQAKDGGPWTWLKADFKAPSISFGDGSTAMQVSDIAYAIEQTRMEGGLPSGTGRFVVGNTTFNSSGKRFQLALRQFSLDIKSTLTEGLYDLAGTYGVGGLIVNGLDFGGGDLMRIGTIGLDSAALRDFSIAFNQASHADSNEEMSSPEVKGKLSALLKKGVQLTAGHQWKASAGENRVDLKIATGDLSAFVDDPSLRFLSPVTLATSFVDALELDVRLSVPLVAALAKNVLVVTGQSTAKAEEQARAMVNAQIASAEKKHRLKRDGDDLVLQLRYAGDKASYNGESMPLPAALLRLGFEPPLEDGGYEDEDDDDE